jgi:hypothetical protein
VRLPHLQRVRFFRCALFYLYLFPDILLTAITMFTKPHLKLALLFVTISFVASAQRSINLQDHWLIKESDKYLYGAPKERYEGTPYLNDSLVTGYLFVGPEKYKGIPMRYNIFQDKIEFTVNKENYYLEPDPRISKVEVGNELLVVRSIGRNPPGFLELLEDGPMKVMAKKVVNHRDKVIISDIPAKYTRSPDIFYYQLSNGKVTKVGSVKDLIAELPDKQSELKLFVQSEKISSKNKDDLIKFARYYNSLVVGH